ncbi:MAG: HTTM domain-containing protein [Ardenticatenaceae bacterium]|nr:HTTM domain-containing protein [Ardenticatenaceae bacterium]
MIGQFLPKSGWSLALPTAGCCSICWWCLFLLWRKTRPFAFLAALLFHLTNARLFSIGIFPGL